MRSILTAGEHLVGRLICMIAAIPSLLFLQCNSSPAGPQDAGPTRNESLTAPRGPAQPWTAERMRRAKPNSLPIESEQIKPQRPAEPRRPTRE